MKSRSRRSTKILSCDFETTVYAGQEYTEVWASAVVELYTEDVHIFHSIGETLEYFKSLNTHVIAYYHNLKFDGNFWLSYLMTNDFQQAIVDRQWLPNKDMPKDSFKYMISDMGMWYTLTIKTGGHIIEIRDSLKLLPFSVKTIGKSFKTKHQKLDMVYEGFRYAGCEITPEEEEYIKNDVLVVKEALEIMFDEGHNKLTIGSCCFSEYKEGLGQHDYEIFHPQLYDIQIDPDVYTQSTAGEWIKKSYKGGWCYLCKGKANRIYHNGTTADVNSLYPSMMHSESGNYYPVGTPTFWNGNYIPDDVLEYSQDTTPDEKRRYFFIRIRTRFYLKPGKLPFIQIKGTWLYKGTRALETSDIYDEKTGTTSLYYKDKYGNTQKAIVELTLTQTDYKLFLEHYNVKEFEIVGGCWFYAMTGLFDNYIDKYKKIKLESTGAKRTLAKLFLNNLYGKMATNTDSSYKVAYMDEDGIISFTDVEEYAKRGGYIAIGSAITSYARNFTIRAAQANYHGKDKPGFIYADTDSIHCDLKPDEIKGIKVHDKNFCCWKLEACWDEAIFTRQKTYIEHVTHEDLEPIEKPYYNIKCAGMSNRPKELFNLSLQGYEVQEGDGFNQEEREFLKTKRELTDFKVGLQIPSKLLQKRIRGGVVLLNTTFELRPE